MLLTAIVILGGIQKISKIATRLVPSMVVLYFITVLVILGIYFKEVPHYISLIFTEAFGNETQDIIITLSLSINNSFEWNEVNLDGLYEPNAGEQVVDMGFRGLIPMVTVE